MTTAVQEKIVSILNENGAINCEFVEKILTDLTENLNESMERLKEVKRINLPKIKEIEREKKEIFEEIGRLKRELNELNNIQPISVLEKRRMDFKTEGEYISKILNRNIKEEFITQMKRELKQIAADETESIDQVLCTAVPGCDELNERLDEKGVEGIAISQKTEKFLMVLNKCHVEVTKKVYSTAVDCDNLRAFEEFCVNLIGSYFTRRIEAKKSNVNSLPQFGALLLNDLSAAIVFLSVHFSGKGARKLSKLRSEHLGTFVKGQEEEISSLICDLNVKSLKKVGLFLSRLEKVLKNLMLKSDLKNIQLILLNFAHEVVWKKLMGIADISEDEIEGLSLYCKEAIGLKADEFDTFLKYRPKLKCYERILNLSLIEIVNSYHRREFKDISDAELCNIVEAIFASSPLRNEFIREVELGCDYYYNAEEEEYF